MTLVSPTSEVCENVHVKNIGKGIGTFFKWPAIACFSQQVP
jgi:hypothetical protein